MPSIVRQATYYNEECRILIWFEDTTAVRKYDVREIFELQDIVDIVEIFDDADRCVEYINSVDQQDEVYLIVHNVSGAQLIRRLKDTKLLKSIYVLLSAPLVIPPWTRSYKNLRCTLSNIRAIRYRLHMDIHDTPLGFDTIGPGSLSLTVLKNTNKQEAMFMYGQLLKNIFTDMSDSDIDFNDMIEFLHEKYKDQPKQIEKINELGSCYASKSAIWWYTTEPFLYSTLNGALRTYDVDSMCAMAVFIRDLHRNIVELQKSTKLANFLKLYRGQVMPKIDFLKIRTNVGGLLSINNFLSTSSNSNVASLFAEDTSYNCEQAAVLFEITLDSSKSTSVAYADIKPYSNYSAEDEFLLTMGSVFRIESITEPDVTGCWRVCLTMTEDHDPELAVLYNYMRSHLQGSDLRSLGRLLFDMGAWDKAIQICEKALKTSGNSESANRGLYQTIAAAHGVLGNIEQSQQALKLEMECQRDSTLTLPDDWSIYVNKAILFFNEGKIDLALEAAQFSLGLLQDSSSEVDQGPFISVYIMLGHIVFAQGKFFESITYHQKAYDIAVKYLPPTHSFIGLCLDQIATGHMLEGRIDQALMCQQESADIMQRSLPPTHPMQENCQSNVAVFLW